MLVHCIAVSGGDVGELQCVGSSSVDCRFPCSVREKDMVVYGTELMRTATVKAHCYTLQLHSGKLSILQISP